MTVFTIAACTLLACKKKDPEVEPKPKDTYFPLAVGNQWVYDTYSVSNDDEETLLPDLRDTIRVEKDTLINGKSYFLLRSSFTPNNDIHLIFADMFNTALRDSSGYIVNSDGVVCFSPDFKSHDTLRTYVGRDISYKEVMTDPNKKITVPAGTFKVLAMERHIWVNTPPSPRRLHHKYFAKNVGPIYNHAFYMSDGKDVYRKKLVAYHLK